MREKRPRISVYKKQSDRIEENVFVGRANGNTEMNQGKSLSKAKLPDIEIDELWQKETYEQTEITNYQLESDVNPGDESKDQQSESSNNMEFLKDIYNTIDFDHSI